MNLSLKNRVSISFMVANGLILILTFVVFYFLNSLNKNIENLTVKSNRVSLLNDEIRISAVSIIKYQRKLLTQKNSAENVEKIVNLCDSFSSQLQNLDGLYQDQEVKKIITQMNSFVESLKVVVSKASHFNRDRDNAGVESIGELSDKILESYSDLQEIQYFQSGQRDQKIKKIINETKRNMMITLIIGFLGTIIIGLVIPSKISLPFKKIKDAIRELQECNFDVSIFYNQEDEIGEIAREMNKMIQSFKVFEDLRRERISVEQRKFDALANMVRKPVLVANAQNKLVYMNNKTYSLLKVQSEEIIGKAMTESLIPATIIESFNLAIKRRSKIENQDIVINISHKEAVNITPSGEQEELTTASGLESSEEMVFKGFANIIPIRAKESSLDYYLMILSTEVFT